MSIRKFNEESSNKKLIVKKGYTLSVISWENDGDNYDTNKKTVESIEEAESLYKLMMLCKSKNNVDERGLGNTTTSKFNEDQIDMIVDFFEKNTTLINGDINEHKCIALFYDLTDQLLGSSEYYLCRVMESCSVTYSPSDIYLEEINF